VKIIIIIIIIIIIVTRIRDGRRGSDSRLGHGYFSSPPRPHQFWGQSRISSGYRWVFHPGGKTAGTRN
jgi:hypothetical protein